MTDNIESDNSELSQMRIAVVDDHELVRVGIKSFLTLNGVNEVYNFSTAGALVAALDSGEEFEFYIIDIELPDMDGFILIEMIRAHHKDARIIVSTIHDEIWTLRKLLVRKVNGIIYKTGNGREIITAFGEILNGNNYYCDDVKKALKYAGDSSVHPSARELEVLKHVAQGKTSREIAAAMCVSENTVEAHRKSLFTKLGAVNVVDLIIKAIVKGYIPKGGVQP